MSAAPSTKLIGIAPGTVESSKHTEIKTYRVMSVNGQWKTSKILCEDRIVT